MAKKRDNKNETPAPVLDAAQESLFREVDEDLRDDRYRALWKTYGSLVIAACVALVLGVAAYEGWRVYENGVRAEASNRFIAATDAAAYAAVAADATPGYALLARLREGEVLLRGGDAAAAAAAFNQVAATADIPLYADLGAMLAVLAELHQTGTANPDLHDRLETLAAGGRPLRFSARELLAYLALRNGDKAEAQQLFQDLANDSAAPTGSRSRAAEMAAFLHTG